MRRQEKKLKLSLLLCSVGFARSERLISCLICFDNRLEVGLKCFSLQLLNSAIP